MKITKKLAVALLCAVSIFPNTQHQGLIGERILSSNGTPVSALTISIQHATHVTLSDRLGFFQFRKLSPGKQILEAASNGRTITSWLYLGGNDYLVYPQLKAERTAYPAGLYVGIGNVTNNTYKLIAG